MATTTTTLYTAPVPLQSSGWAHSSFVLCIVLPTLSTIAVILRFYSRRVGNAKIQLSDWLMLGALLGFYLLCTVGIVGLFEGGFGRDITSLAPEVVQNASKILLIAENIYALSLGLAKASALSLLLKVFGRSKLHRILVWVTIALTISWALMAILISFLICRPLAYNWDFAMNGTCGNEYAAFESVAVLDIIVDLSILLLPASMIIKFKMSLLARLAMIAVFAFGFLDIASAVLRLSGSLQVDFNSNFTQTIGPLYFWSIFEPGLAIIVASSITLTPLIERFLPNHVQLTKPDHDSDTDSSSDTESTKSSMTDDFFTALRKMDGTASVEFSCYAGEAERHDPSDLRFFNEEVNVRTDVIIERKITIMP